jgi:tetratricopeptide (TPR) repeat protein
VPAKEIVQTARLVATGRLADAKGDLAAAAKTYEDAVFIEDTLAYMEPPYWYYPVRQSLGGVLLRQGKLDSAEKAFRESLARVRNNGWALAGSLRHISARVTPPARSPRNALSPRRGSAGPAGPTSRRYEEEESARLGVHRGARRRRVRRWRWRRRQRSAGGRGDRSGVAELRTRRAARRAKRHRNAELARIVWQTPVDLTPPYLANNVLHIHYGSPVVTARNTVLIPVKLNRDSGFRVEARTARHGCAHVVGADRLRSPRARLDAELQHCRHAGQSRVLAGAGGKLFYRDNADAAEGAVQSIAFYGNEAYDAARSIYDASVFINTPLTVDPRGNVYFGFIVTGATPASLASGIARVSADGSATWVAARVAANDPQVVKPAMNSGPALSNDLSTVYAVLTNFPPAGEHPFGVLVALDAQTLHGAQRGYAARSRDRSTFMGERQRKRVADRRPRRRRVLRRAGVEHARAQLPRLASALQRRSQRHEAGRIVRVGPDGVGRPGGDGAPVHGAVELPHRVEVQQLRGCRHRQRAQPDGDPRPVHGAAGHHLAARARDARGADDARPDAAAHADSGLGARVVREHGRGRRSLRARCSSTARTGDCIAGTCRPTH